MQNQILQNYLTKEEFLNFTDLKKSLNENLITLACIGLYNNGKSSILNACINDLNEETFKVSDARQTVSNKEIIYQDINFIDTPGLNVTNEDDKEVFKALKKSDINLFVHKVSTGELGAKEMEFLNYLE